MSYVTYHNVTFILIFINRLLTEIHLMLATHCIITMLMNITLHIYNLLSAKSAIKQEVEH